MKTKRFLVCIALSIFVLISSGQSCDKVEIPVGAENSIIVKNIPQYKIVGAAMQLVVIELIKSNKLTKDKAYELGNVVYAMLDHPDLTYLQFIYDVKQEVSFLRDNLGKYSTEILIIATAVNVLNQPIIIDPYDRQLLKKWLVDMDKNLSFILPNS